MLTEREVHARFVEQRCQYRRSVEAYDTMRFDKAVKKVQAAIHCPKYVPLRVKNGVVVDR